MKKIFVLSPLVALLAGCITFTSDCECGNDCACTKPCACKAAPNTLSAAEEAEGWQLLWDGKTLNGWVGVKNLVAGRNEAPAHGWEIKDGILTVLPCKSITKEGHWADLPPELAKLGGAGDICTKKEYRDFEFKIDYRLTPAANRGIKYFYNPKKNKGTTLEYQLLDSGHPDWNRGKNGSRRVSALYDIFPASENAAKKVGEWNTAKIVSKGNRVEHWLNGVKVLEFKRKSGEFRRGVNASKYAKWGTEGEKKYWGELETGRILIQDHQDSRVSFRNIKIREL